MIKSGLRNYLMKIVVTDRLFSHFPEYIGSRYERIQYGNSLLPFCSSFKIANKTPYQNKMPLSQIFEGNIISKCIKCRRENGMNTELHINDRTT